MQNTSPSQPATTADADLRMTLDEQVNELPEKLRRVVVCCYLQGLTREETARRLNWAERTVSARLKEARELLRKRLGENELSEKSLASALAPVAVPTLLHSATVNAGAAVAAGKLAAAVSAKVVSMSQATGKAMALAKLKLAAAMIAAATVTVAATAAISQFPKAQPPVQTPAPQPTAVAKAPPTPATTRAFTIQLTTHLPPELERAVRENELSLDPIAVSWTYQNYSEIPSTQPTVTLKASASHFIQRQNLLYWQNGKVYNRSTSVDQGSNEVSYDGRVWYGCNTYPKEAPRLTKRLLANMIEPNKQPLFRQTWLWDNYFTEAGLRALSSTDEMAAGRAQPEVIDLIEHGGQIVSVETVDRNKSSLVKVHVVSDNVYRKIADHTTGLQLSRSTAGMTPASAKRYAELLEAEKKMPLKQDSVFYFDPAKNYAMVGREESYGPQMLSVTNGEAFRQIPGRKVWLPGKTVKVYYTYPNNPPAISDRPLWRQEIELTEISVAPIPEDRFVLDYRTPGTQVMDATLAGAPANYTVKATPDGAVRTGPPPGSEALAHSTPAQSAPDHHPAVIIGTAVGAIVVAAAGAWAVSRRRTSRPGGG